MNPINSKSSNGQQVGTAPANPINDPGFVSTQGSSTYELSAPNLLTARFGEVTPFFYFNAIGRDRLELRSSQDLRTYTLGAPLMSSVRMKKSYFSVPLKCIMPNTWDYLFVNPVKGNDVPDDAYSLIDIWHLVYVLAASCADQTYSASSTGLTEAELGTIRFRLFMLVFLLISKGSLLDYLGISTAQLVEDYDFLNSVSAFDPELADNIRSKVSVDKSFDLFCNYLASVEDYWSISFIYDDDDPVSGEQFPVSVNINNYSSLSEIRQWFYSFVEHPDARLSYPSNYNNFFKNTFFSYIIEFCSCVADAYRQFNPSVTDFSDKPAVTLPVNLYKVVAYQMICAQYYTNDHVDSLYNANLWLSNMKSLQGLSSESFSYNGVPVYYDVFSNHNLDLMLQQLYKPFVPGEKQNYLYFLFNLFSYRRSLRYGDYFMSSRPQPLAVGDVTVPVVGEGVNVIDVNKNLHIQRFLNAVNRLGSNILEYTKGIFGYRPQAVEPTPNFISSEYLVVGCDEIDNTAQDQGTVNTNLVSQSSQYAFDVNITDNSVILGLCSFEVLGAYPYTVERDNLHSNRYDMFNPFLQHLGDQEVKALELGYCKAIDVPFGYQVRYAEYKFKYPQQHGGFNDESLRLWSMPYKFDYGHTVLSEDAIRFNQSDFDKFYKSLTYSSLANYFHFQICFQNSLRANRAMDFQPNLLG